MSHGFAIVLGVAMVSGTFVLTDTLKAGFGAIFTSVYKSTDAVITGKSAIGNGNNGNIAPVDAGVAAREGEQPPGCRCREGRRQRPGAARRSRRQGDLTGFAPGLGVQRRSEPGPSSSTRSCSTAGTWPRGPHEIAIDKSTADNKHYAVGDSIGAVARGPVQQYRITGIVKLGNVSSIGGATMAIFDLPTAQKIFGKVGKLDAIDVAAQAGRLPCAARRADQARSCRPRHRCGAARRRPRSR